MGSKTDIEIIRTNASNEDFRILVAHLDKELAVRDGKDHDFYHQFNLLDDIKYVVLAYSGDLPIACGAIKAFDDDAIEVKRMYTRPQARGRGIARKVLKELESWAEELNYQHCILETGKKQPEAIALYTKMGYSVIENYGQYADVANSVCFSKSLK